MGSLAGRRPHLRLGRAPARSIPTLGNDHAGDKRTRAWGCSSPPRSLWVTAVEAFMLEPLDGDQTVRSANP